MTDVRVIVEEVEEKVGDKRNSRLIFVEMVTSRMAIYHGQVNSSAPEHGKFHLAGRHYYRMISGEEW